MKRSRQLTGRLSVAGLVVAALISVQVVPASASPAGTKGAPPEPTIGEFSSALAPPVTGALKVQADAKAASAAKFYAQAQAAWKAQAAGTVVPQLCPTVAQTSRTPDLACPAPPPTSKTLVVSYLQQQTENWCGPTTLAMIVAYKGKGFAGSKEYDKELTAAKLVTDPGSGSSWEERSTDWYGTDSVPSGAWSSYYPMQDALNYKTYGIVHNYYTPVTLPSNPTSAQQAAFKNALVTDIVSGWPFAANQDSVPNYNIGYQPNQSWQHWWAAIGYSSSGNTTYFDDPASWSQRRVSHATTTGGQHTVVSALGGRGYVW